MGRTGRAGKEGHALTLVGPSDAAFAESLSAALAASRASAAAAAAAAAGGGGGAGEGVAGGRNEGGGAGEEPGLAAFGGLARAAVEALRYRSEDVARSITKNVIREVGLRNGTGRVGFGWGRCWSRASQST